MVRGFVSLVVTAALFQACIVTTNGNQQDQKRVREVEKVRQKIIERGVGPRATVGVQLRNGTRLVGVIYETNEEEFTLIEVPNHRPARIAYSEVKKVRYNLKAALNRKIYLTVFSLMAGTIILWKVIR